MTYKTGDHVYVVNPVNGKLREGFIYAYSHLIDEYDICFCETGTYCVCKSKNLRPYYEFSFIGEEHEPLQRR